MNAQSAKAFAEEKLATLLQERALSKAHVKLANQVRVWDPSKHEFLSINVDNYRLTFQGDVWIASNTCLSSDNIAKTVENSRFLSPNSPFLQVWTGLKDKKGTYVYEGDIVEFEYWVGDFAWEFMDEDEIKWQESQLGKAQLGVITQSPISTNLELSVPQDIGIATYQVSYAGGKNAKIVGHIFDGVDHFANFKPADRSKTINFKIAIFDGWERQNTGYGEIWKDRDIVIDGNTKRGIEPPDYANNFDALRKVIYTAPEAIQNKFLEAITERYGKKWSIIAPVTICAVIFCQAIGEINITPNKNT